MQIEQMQAVVIEVVKPFFGEAIEFGGDTSLLEDGTIDSMIMNSDHPGSRAPPRLRDRRDSDLV